MLKTSGPPSLIPPATKESQSPSEQSKSLQSPIVQTPLPVDSKLLIGRVIAITSSTMTIDIYNSNPAKTIVLTLDSAIEYATATGKKSDIKVGDYIAARFKDSIDLKNQSSFIPVAISVLPPPPIQK